MLVDEIIIYCPAFVDPRIEKSAGVRAMLGKLFGMAGKSKPFLGGAFPPRAGAPAASAFTRTFGAPFQSAFPSAGSAIPQVAASAGAVPSMGGGGSWMSKLFGAAKKPLPIGAAFRYGVPTAAAGGLGLYAGGKGGYEAGYQVGGAENTGETLADVYNYMNNYMANNKWKTLGAGFQNLLGMQPSAESKLQTLHDFVGQAHNPARYRNILPMMEQALGGAPAAAPAAAPAVKPALPKPALPKPAAPTAPVVAAAPMGNTGPATPDLLNPSHP